MMFLPVEDNLFNNTPDSISLLMLPKRLITTFLVRGVAVVDVVGAIVVETTGKTLKKLLNE